MSRLIYIDGNNLWHAMQAGGNRRAIGRQQLVVLLDRWACAGGDQVTVVFDGPTPPDGMSAQMRTPRIRTRFSGHVTADEVLVGMIEQAKDPGRVCVVTGDRAIQHAARARRCATVTANEFIREMFQPDVASSTPADVPRDEPEEMTKEEVQRWLDQMEANDDTLPPYWQQG